MSLDPQNAQIINPVESPSIILSTMTEEQTAYANTSDVERYVHTGDSISKVGDDFYVGARQSVIDGNTLVATPCDNDFGNVRIEEEFFAGGPFAAEKTMFFLLLAL
jgi:hypothetical protein